MVTTILALFSFLDGASVATPVANAVIVKNIGLKGRSGSIEVSGRSPTLTLKGRTGSDDVTGGL